MTPSREPERGPTGSGDPPLDVVLDVPIRFDTADGTLIHSPMIEATVGGFPTRLILDTGSTDHVLVKPLLDRAGVAARPAEDGTDHAGAAVPSWFVGDLPIVVDGRALDLRDVVAIAPPARFEAWGVGGFLSPQHLDADARVLVDLVGDRLVIVRRDRGDTASIDVALAARRPELRRVSLRRDPDFTTIVAHGAVVPFATSPTMLNTGGRGTEAARSVVPGLAGAAPAKRSEGLSGAGVVGSEVGPCTIAVGQASVPVGHLLVRDQMDDPPVLIGMDVLRQTALIVGADPASPISWLVPPAWIDTATDRRR